jgi:intein/homing endonuclease
MLNTLRNLDLLQNKHIPLIYKCNSRENRLKLLAGLIDSDGHLIKNGGFEFTQKNERLMDDVIYLARSLGFSCDKKIKNTSWTYKGEKKTGTYEKATEEADQYGYILNYIYAYIYYFELYIYMCIYRV